MVHGSMKHKIAERVNKFNDNNKKCLHFFVVGQLNVTLAVFSGRPDPQWFVVSDDPRYAQIQKLIVAARNQKLTYPPNRMPPRLGYKGFLIQELTQIQTELIVGGDTVALQKLLFQTLPKGNGNAFIWRRLHVLPPPPPHADIFIYLFISSTFKGGPGLYREEEGIFYNLAKRQKFTTHFLTREYAKRNERVIGMDGNFTHSLARSITQM